MKKLLDYIWNNTKWFDGKTWLGVLVNRRENDIYYYIEIKQRKIINCKNNNSYMIYIIPLMQALLSLIVFILLYKYDIKLFSDNIIMIIKLLLFLFFWLFVIILISMSVFGLYLIVKDKDYEIIEKSIKILIRFINFIINVKIMYWVLDLNIELFLQYNILLVMNTIMMFIFFIYKYIYDYEIKGKKIVIFLQYPWILMLVILILLLIGNININRSIKYVINVIFKDYFVVVRYEVD